MTAKRFVDNGFEAIEEQSFTDTETDKTYYVDYFDEIIDLCNKLNDENEQLKQQVEDLEFELRTIKAYDITVKEEHSDTVYDFKKKLEKW